VRWIARNILPENSKLIEKRKRRERQGISSDKIERRKRKQDADSQPMLLDFQLDVFQEILDLISSLFTYLVIKELNS